MKKFFVKFWLFLNSPIFDILGGCCLTLGGLFVFYTRSELTKPCFFAFIAGCLITMAIDCFDHGFRWGISSAHADDNK